jgi:multiple sugar transport system permease protein
LENYKDIFADPVFWRSFKNTVWFVLVVVYAELLIGLSIGLLFQKKIIFKKFMISIVMAPYAVSPVLGSLMWRFILEPEIGVVNLFFQSAGLPQFLWTVNPSQAFLMIVILSIWLRIPFTFLVLYNALLGVPKELIEAAKIDGASSSKAFMSVTLPTIMPAILVSLIFRLIFALRTFDVVWVLTKGGPFRSTELLSVYLYRRGFTYFEFGVASAVAWVMVLLTIIIGIYYLVAFYRSSMKNA